GVRQPAGENFPRGTGQRHSGSAWLPLFLARGFARADQCDHGRDRQWVVLFGAPGTEQAIADQYIYRVGPRGWCCIWTDFARQFDWTAGPGRAVVGRWELYLWLERSPGQRRRLVQRTANQRQWRHCD